jgi:polysaccharide biosynthesis/export protein
MWVRGAIPAALLVATQVMAQGLQGYPAFLERQPGLQQDSESGMQAPQERPGRTPLAPQFPGTFSPTRPGLITNVPGTQGVQDPLQQQRQRISPYQARLPAPPPPPNEFQLFIAQSIGKLLPLYGQELFLDVPSTFAPVEDIPVTPDYVIGPGDELHVRAWGQTDIDYVATVGRDGTISIPRIGVISVAGIRYQDLSDYVKKAVARVYRNFELTVTLGRLRAIQVFVVGHARQPGSYTVSSLSTLVNAIFAAGGPSASGSMRSIQLKRANKTVADLDLYDLLLAGDKSKDTQLLPGDVIYFAPIGPLVALAGSINMPAIYELKGPTTLEQLIKWSGGLATTAQTRTATIERIDERRSRVVDKFSLDPTSLSRALHDGDLVTVLQVAPRFENAVTLRGSVAVPLRHPFVPGMRIRDLIPDKEALITYEYYRRQNRAIQTDFLQERVRSGAEATAGALERGTESEAAAERSARGARADRVERERLARERLERPSERTVERADSARMDRADRRISPEKVFAEINWDYAVVERLSETDFSSTLIPFNLGKAILENDPAHNVALRPGDIVTIFSKEDINVPVGRQTKFVRLEGEFNLAGVYQVQPGETLRQLIARAGGLSPAAYVFGAEFTRESVRVQQQRTYQETLNRLERDAQQQSAERARSALSPEDAEALKVALAAEQATIARLRELKPTGRISLELPLHAKPTDLPDLPLENGDRIFVPAQPAMVSVYGSVFTEGSFLHKTDRTASDYVALAGGATRRADTSQIFVIRADGSAAGQGGWSMFSRAGNVRVMPGDTVVVPEDFERQTLTRTLKDWSQIFFNFGLGAAAIKVLRD